MFVRFCSGFYLYWGEGTKTAEYTVALTSSDPGIINCFIEWLELLGVSKIAVVHPPGLEPGTMRV